MTQGTAAHETELEQDLLRSDEKLHPLGPERQVLLLQGGGALGSYQAGVYEELSCSHVAPDWVAGISIGAINAAIIAGNPPEKRVERLREFWYHISAYLTGDVPVKGERARSLFNEMSSNMAAVFGLNGFFKPRFPPAPFQPKGSMEALSYYDTSPLRETLLRLVDFDRINNGDVRLSVGAVNVRTGNFVYFDNRQVKIGPEHIMASGALPPGFPPVEIDGQLYWDGGLVSNTPLQYVFEGGVQEDLLIFQCDLFAAQGLTPHNLLEVAEREKDIRFSSRTRKNTDEFRRLQTLRSALYRLLEKMPPELRDDPDAKLLSEVSSQVAVSIVHLIYRAKHYESHSKDYEFSRKSVDDHWKAGRFDVRRTLRHPKWQDRVRPESGIAVFDLAKDAVD